MKISKRGTKKPNISSLYKNENLKKGDQKNFLKTNKKGKKPISSLHENENLKKGDEKNF